jgi:hypothetical protein
VKLFLNIDFLMLTIFRYPVAIKCPKASMPGGIDVFLEEAKSMLEVDDYHANIVNLQGMTYKNSSPEESSIDVCFSISKSCFFRVAPFK